MTFVLDASVTLAWFHEDERTPATDGLLAQATEFGALGSVHVAARSGKRPSARCATRSDHPTANRDAALSALASMPVAIDPETGIHAWSTTLDLSTRFSLTVYDAAYLELAMRRGLPLATLDRDLRAAASAAGITLLGL